MIINNKICKLTDVYEITDDKMKFLKVKLIIFNNKKINFSYMFYDCVSLIDFEIYSKQEVEFNKKFYMQKKKIPTSIKNENNSIQIDNKSEDIYKTIIENNNDPTSNNSRTNSIYNSSCENQNISLEYELEEKIINSGSNFLSNKFNSTELMYNDNEFFSINTNTFSPTVIKKITKKIETGGNIYKKNINLYHINLKIPKKINIFAIDLSYMFYGCSSLLKISGLSKLKVNYANMSHMFENCSKLKEIKDIFQLNNKINDDYKLNDLSFVFSNCSSLISLPDISNWNIGNVENISGIFNECSSLISIPDISQWNTINVKDMSDLFSDCPKLKSLPDISNWNTCKVENMSGIFACYSLTKPKSIISKNKNNDENMNTFFEGHSSLIELPDISN